MNRIYTWLVVSCCCVLGLTSHADEFACTPAELFTALSGPNREIQDLTEAIKRPSLWIDFTDDRKVYSVELMVSSYKDFGVFVQPLAFSDLSKDGLELEEVVAQGNKKIPAYEICLLDRWVPFAGSNRCHFCRSDMDICSKCSTRCSKS